MYWGIVNSASSLLVVLLQIFINAKIRRSGFCVILPLNWTLTFCAKLPMCDSSDRGTGSQARLRSPLLATLATLGFRRPDQETRTGQELASDGTRRWSGPGTRSSCCQLSLDTVTHCAVRAGVTVLCWGHSYGEGLRDLCRKSSILTLYE